MTVGIVGKQGNKDFWGIRIHVSCGALATDRKPIQEYISFKGTNAALRKELTELAIEREVEIRDDLGLISRDEKLQSPFIFEDKFRHGRKTSSPFFLRGMTLVVEHPSSTRGVTPDWIKTRNNYVFNSYPPRIKVQLLDCKGGVRNSYNKSFPIRKSTDYKELYTAAVEDMIRVRPYYEPFKEHMLSCVPPWKKVRENLENQHRHNFKEWPWNMN